MPFRRRPGGPLLTRGMIPDGDPRLADPTSVFNPGALKCDGRYLLMLRVQNRGRETFLLPATGDDGENFRISGEPVRLRGAEPVAERVHHFYDPRLTRIDGRFHMLLAMDLGSVCRLGLAASDDFTLWDFLGVVSDANVRNGVLFPEKIGGRYLRLERPNRLEMSGGGRSGDEIALAESDDLLTWRRTASVCGGRAHYWDELIGPGPPPVKTREGWLLVYHGVATHFASANVYQAGVLLLDLADPSRLLARGRYNVLEPRESWELTGQVPNVVFPSGLIVERTDAEGFALPGSEVKLYYGAADTCVGLATSTIERLIRAAKQE